MIISIDNIKPGMQISENVVNNEGMLVVVKDTVVTDNIIKRLIRYNISEINVNTSADSNIKKNILKNSPDLEKFKNDMGEVKDSLNNSFNSIITDCPDKETLNQVIDCGMSFYYDNCKKNNILDILYCIQEFSDTTYVHCINVSMIAGLLAKWLFWSEEDVNKVVVCGLFHDIGKLMIPNDILNKPGKLTNQEYSFMKKHSEFGFVKLKDIELLPAEVKRAALLHHERCDGSGYPFGLKRNKIDKYSKIIAIADVYDALTANRIYREAMCPFDVISILEQEGLERYETRYILTFLQQILNSYLNKKVELSNGEIVTIDEINHDARSKPVVVMDGGKKIDLSKMSEVKIVKICE